MPELPEVETIRRGLEKYLIGQQIAGIDVLSSKQFIGDPRRVIGAEITMVRRFGKGLVIDLSNGFSIAIHVKMTGRLIYNAGNRLSTSSYHTSKHTHVIFKLESNLTTGLGSSPQGGYFLGGVVNRRNSKSLDSFLYYNDIRKFGWIKVVETKDVMDLPFFKSLGPEPMRNLDLPLFEDILASSKRPIKAVLMDQHKISGLGNIYANDALFLAKIHPLKPAFILTKKEASRLLEAIEKVLRKSINEGGASMSNYVSALGEKGAYQEHFLVYGREGEPCPVCKTSIKKMKMCGRGTFYCRKCQK